MKNSELNLSGGALLLVTGVAVHGDIGGLCVIVGMLMTTIGAYLGDIGE